MVIHFVGNMKDLEKSELTPQCKATILTCQLLAMCQAQKQKAGVISFFQYWSTAFRHTSMCIQ